MSLQDLLKDERVSVQSVDFKDNFELIQSIINTPPNEEIELFNLTDDKYVVRLYSRKHEETKTITIGGRVSLKDYKQPNLMNDEIKHAKEYSLIKGVSEIITKRLIPETIYNPKENYIDGNGTFYLYRSNEYRAPEATELNEFNKLIMNEIAVGMITSTALFDSIKRSIGRENSNVSKKVADYIKETISEKDYSSMFKQETYLTDLKREVIEGMKEVNQNLNRMYQTLIK